MKTNIFIIKRHGNTCAKLLGLFENKGYFVHCSRSLIEVLEEIHSDHLSSKLIITDTEIQLFEGFGKLRKYLTRHQVPIIYLGPKKDSEFKSQTNLYVFRHLQKPCDSNYIFGIAESYFERQAKTELKVPEGIRIFETQTSTLWFDEKKENTLCCVIKSFPQNVENTMEFYKTVKSISGNQKVNLLIDITLIHPSNKNNKDYLMTESKKYFSSVAILSNSVFGRFVANFFVAFKNSSVPVKLFSDEQAARNWLS